MTGSTTTENGRRGSEPDPADGHEDSRWSPAYWLGTSVIASTLGSSGSAVALPLVAIELLDADAGDIASLSVLFYLVAPIAGLVGGQLNDRFDGVRVMQTIEAFRLLVTLALVARLATDTLRLLDLQIYAVLVGLVGVPFSVAYRSVVPKVVAEEDLKEVNSKLSAGYSAAEVSGQSLAGVVQRAFGAVTVVVLDAMTFVVSLVVLARVRARSATDRDPERRPVGRLEGLKFIRRNANLRRIFLSFVLAAIAADIVLAVYPYILRVTLQLDAAQVGLVFAAGSVGGVAGALLAGRIRAVPRWILIASALGEAAGWGLLGLAVVRGSQTFWLAVLASAVATFSLAVFNVTQLTYRQVVTSLEAQGRVHAAFMSGILAVSPVALYAGGRLTERYGARFTTLLAAGLTVASVLFFIRWDDDVPQPDVPDLPE